MTANPFILRVPDADIWSIEDYPIGAWRISPSCRVYLTHSPRTKLAQSPLCVLAVLSHQHRENSDE
jgi:hypothetical protein